MAQDPSPGGHGPLSPLTTLLAAAKPCPIPPAGKQGLSGPGKLPSGALAIRVCPAAGGTPPKNLPTAALTRHTDQVVDLVNGSPRARHAERCTMDFGPSYALQATYADGHSVVAIGEMYGCDHLYVGHATRSGDAAAVYDRVVKLIGRQP